MCGWVGLDLALRTGDQGLDIGTTGCPLQRLVEITRTVRAKAVRVFHKTLHIGEETYQTTSHGASAARAGVW